MSKLAKKPILIPEGIGALIKDGNLEFKSQQRESRLKILDFINIEIKDRQIAVKPSANHKQAKANLGTMAALIKNALAGFQKDFTKTLELVGIGFRASLEKNHLILSVGFTHPVKYAPPAEIKISLDKNKIIVSGADKKLVGQTAADIRKIKPPEPYKGAGIRYADEIVRHKAGKKAVAAGAAGAAAA
jgi:large subunit ribosomal protein L6